MIEYGFFDSVNGDRKYNADSFNEFFNGILSDTGVYKKSGGGLKVVPSEDLAINISTGKARINQHYVNIKSTETLTLPTADVANGRYDAVILRYDETERKITLGTLTGTPSSNPSYPTISRNENTFDICLAYVYVAAGATSISESSIIDKRDDIGVCGYVSLQIDAINAGIRQYRNTFQLTEDANEILIGIKEYDAENDLLFANINGITLVEGVDYTVSGTGSTAKMSMSNILEKGNVIEFKIVKSVIEVL